MCPTRTGHTEDAGTCRGLRRPPCTGSSIGTQHQGVRTAALEAAQRVETAVRAEGKAGPAFINIHVAMLPSPAWGALALVWSGADTSIKTRLGANGFTGESSWVWLLPALAAHHVCLLYVPPHLPPSHAVRGPVGATYAPSSTQGQVGFVHRLTVGLIVTERN